MKSWMKVVGVLLLCLGGLVGLVAWWVHPPSQPSVVANFQAHRAEFEQMRDTFLEEDPTVEIVSAQGIETRDQPSAKSAPVASVSAARYEEYSRLLKQADAIAIARGERKHEVRILVWASGFAADTRHVAIDWLDQEPADTATDLASFYRTPKPRTPVHVHINGHWYIWADW